MLHQIAWLAAVTILGVLEQGKDNGTTCMVGKKIL